MTGIIIRTTHKITRKEVRENADTTYYVFGDNMVRHGFGGLAKEVRNERNSVGIPTKHFPSREARAYFTDEVMNSREIMGEIDGAIRKIDWLLKAGYDIVIPEDGVGTGLSELPERAPQLYNYIEQKLEFLQRKYRSK